MPLQETDISWQVLRPLVEEWAGQNAELEEVRRLTGGSVNTTLLLQTQGGERAVLKISPHRVNRELEREGRQLAMLRKLDMPVPQVYLSHIADLDVPHSYLLMEYMEGEDFAAVRRETPPAELEPIQRQLADLVAKLHENTADAYHRPGTENGQSTSYQCWPEFYRAIYDPIWQEVEKSGALPAKERKKIAKIHEKLDRLLANDDVPRLVHWDIWGSNILVKKNDAGEWTVAALLDPNCKYAHSEAEIAYMELFGTITPAFMKAYQQSHRLPPAYQQTRKPIYQLYPLLNHVRLFGNGYVKPLLGALERAAAVA